MRSRLRYYSISAVSRSKLRRPFPRAAIGGWWRAFGLLLDLVERPGHPRSSFSSVSCPQWPVGRRVSKFRWGGSPSEAVGCLSPGFHSVVRCGARGAGFLALSPPGMVKVRRKDFLCKQFLVFIKFLFLSANVLLFIVKFFFE